MKVIEGIGVNGEMELNKEKEKYNWHYTKRSYIGIGSSYCLYDGTD